MNIVGLLHWVVNIIFILIPNFLFLLSLASLYVSSFQPTSFPLPWYQKVPLSLALSPRIISEVARFKPDIIHASSPGIMASILFLLLVLGYFIYLFSNVQ